MINLHEVEEAIRELEESSATYNNCMKLASLYIIRDELKKQGYSQYNYTNSNYGYYPMYERGGRGGNSSSSYGYRRPMYYDNEDLMIKKNMMHDSEMDMIR